MYLLPGVVGFLAFILFDINKIRWHAKPLNLLFAFGILLLLGSTALCVPNLSEVGSRFDVRRIAGLAGLLASGLGVVYALFFALPFDKTYTEGGDLPLVSQGLYGMCRHPAFWPFASLYFFLWLFFTGRRMFLAAILYTVCNFIYICVQDRYIFPQYIRGYSNYKKTVPFLLPTRESVKRAFSTKNL